MDRAQLIHALNNYQTSFEEEQAFIPRFKSILANFSNCYNRSLVSGHMTASAWIIDGFGTSALLVQHKKLNRWLQPGGHADGDENIIAVAAREAREETGLNSLKLVEEHVFDIDIHLIPRYKNIQSHYHHDIRFLFVADKTEDYVINHESNELAWIQMDKIYSYTGNNSSVQRMVLKTKLIFK